MSRQRPPVIVAELGRPETPEETIARKAEASRKRRSRQTISNLWLSLIASLAVVLVLVLIVPRGDQQFAPDVDYRQVAQEAQGAVDVPLVVPAPGKGWRSNSAVLRTGAADKIVTWYIGFLTPANDYLGFSQGVEANPTWLANLLQQSRADSTQQIGGREWTVYDNRDTDGHGNVEYALSTETPDGIVAIYGTADPAEAEQLATAVGKDLDADE
jgi:hypothetical protein